MENESRKNPQKNKKHPNRGDLTVAGFKKNGPIFPIFSQNLGEQLTPIPETKGLKNQENGKEKMTNEKIRTNEFKNNL